jgi:orotate phosphoribosyltransferase
MPDQQEIWDILKRVDAVREGHFRYTSGLHGRIYVQCALLLKEPMLAAKVCAGLADRFRQDRPEAVVGPAVGAVNLSYEVARQLEITSLFTERGDDGKMVLRRAFEIKPGQRVLVVEDVITTGGTTQETADLMTSLGARVVGAGSIVDRSGGKAKLTVPYFSLLRLDAEHYDPEQCPLCAAGIPIEKPGSRKIVS